VVHPRQLFLLDQVFVHQGSQPVKHIHRQVGLAHSLNGFQRAASLEDSQARKHFFLIFVQQLVTPIQRPAQGLLAHWSIA
jgi:hypothetical protein